MSPTTTTADRSTWQRIRDLAGRAWRLEVGVWLSLYRFLLRRPRVPEGAVGFSYHQPVKALLIGFLVISAIELVVVDLFVQQWPLVRIPLLILGIWGLTWMVGYLFGYLTRPHAVGPQGIRVRQGPEIELAVPWEAVRSVAEVQHLAESTSTPRLADGPGGRVLHLWMQQATNLEIVLDEPLDAVLPQGAESVTVVRLHADEPSAFLAEVRRRLATAGGY